VSGYDRRDADVTGWSAAPSGITEATDTVHGPEPSSATRSGSPTAHGSTRTRLRHRRRRLSAQLRQLPDDAPARPALVAEIARLAAVERLILKDHP
jgi:hypothetical protein